MSTAHFCDELPLGFGWIAEHPPHLRRASHALAEDRQVWLVDPIEIRELDERIQALGKVVGVIQLLDRHSRDSVTLARRFGVPLYHAPTVGAPGSPFHVLRAVNLPLWRESALWWPEQKTLVVGDALGTASYFLGPGERLAVHPLLRLFPPRCLAKVAPENVLCGHGEGVRGEDATAALREALQGARRGIPRWLVGLARRRDRSA